MKKVLLSLLAVAALVLSCQNYDDEFDALNSKISSLESQITSLADLRTAVTGVQSSISALQSAVAAAQAAAEAADNSDAITALATSVTAIAADLVDLQTAIDGATTEADLTALKAELNTTLAALQALIESNSASIANLVISNTELKDALEELGVDVDSVLAANASFEGNLTITNASELAYARSLGSRVATIRGDVYVKVDENTHTGGGTGTGVKASEVNPILSQITYVIGNVKLDSDESLDISALTGITGDYIVLTHDVMDDKLTTVGGDVWFDYDGPYISKIEKAGNIYLVPKASAAAGTTTAAVTGTTSIDFLAISEATGIQTASSSSSHTSGASIAVVNSGSADTKAINVNVGSSTKRVTTSIKIGQAPVVSVSGSELTTLELHYAADYSTTNTTGSTALGSLSVVAPKLSSAVVKAMTINGDVTFDVKSSSVTGSDTSITMNELEVVKGKFTSDAVSHSLPELTYAYGFEFSEALSVALPEVTSSRSTGSYTGAITLAKATSFSAPKLVYAGQKETSELSEERGDITANAVTGALSLPELELAGAISATNASSFAAPDAVVNSVTLDTEATSVEIASVGTARAYSTIPTPASAIAQYLTLTTIKLNAQRSTYLGIEEAEELVTLVYKGYAPANTESLVNVTVDATNVDLTNVTLGGKLQAASINTGRNNYSSSSTSSAKLTSVITSGTINNLVVQGNYSLTTLTLGHQGDATSPTAPVVKIIDNKTLSSFTTSISMIGELRIVDNISLSSFDLSSINSIAQTSAINNVNLGITIDIRGNHRAPSQNSTVGLDASTAVDTDLSNIVGIKGTFVPLTSTAARSHSQSSLATLSNLWSAIDARFPDADSDGSKQDGEVMNIYVNIQYQHQTTDNTVGSVIVTNRLSDDGTINTNWSVSENVVSASSTGTLSGSNRIFAFQSNGDVLEELKKFN